jgi:hypothetical protein
VSSWFGSWIRRGGPLALSPVTTSSDHSLEGGYTESPRLERTEFTLPEGDTDTSVTLPEMEVVRDDTSELVDVKSPAAFPVAERRRSSGTIVPGGQERLGSLTLSNVVFQEDVFRVTGYHNRLYHVDYHLQSMPRSTDVDNVVFRVLKEDILFFMTPPTQSLSNLPLELPRMLQGEKKVSCVVADMDTLEIYRLRLRMVGDEEIQERERLTPKVDRTWRKVQEWALKPSQTSMDQLLKDIFS